MPVILRSLFTRWRLSVLCAPWVKASLRRLARLRLTPDQRSRMPELVFVTPPTTAQGWILDAICREIAQRLPEYKLAFCRMGERLPLADRYFFSHYMYFVNSISLLSPLHSGRCHVFATHLEPGKHGIDGPLLAHVLNAADGVVCMNSQLKHQLAALGTSSDLLDVIVGAADTAVYRPHQRRANGSVGFCSAFYERKSPDRVLDIVRGLPHRHFILLGKGWKAYRRFDELSSLPNFQYVEADYSDYPGHYARMSVFVSASMLEGGPIPLLEAMMSNVVPVASKTGFAPDVIRDCENGFLFDIDADAAEICGLIEKAFELDTAVDPTVKFCDWAEFSARTARHLNLPRTGH
jgi:glycosyltransferase involved in cell wall biosynthesis